MKLGICSINSYVYNLESNTRDKMIQTYILLQLFYLFIYSLYWPPVCNCIVWLTKFANNQNNTMHAQGIYPSLHPFGVAHWVAEQLNIKAVSRHASWLMVAALKKLCSATPSGIMPQKWGQLNCMQRLCDWVKGRSISVSYTYILL